MFVNELTFNFDLDVVDVIYNWVSVDEDKRRGIKRFIYFSCKNKI